MNDYVVTHVGSWSRVNAPPNNATNTNVSQLQLQTDRDSVVVVVRRSANYHLSTLVV